MAVIEELDESNDAKMRAESLKKEGNTHFGKGHWDDAVSSYDAALQALPDGEELSLRAVLHNNKLEKWEEAAEEATDALELGADSEKALERRAFALYNVESKYDDSIRDYKSLLEKQPTKINYATRIAELEEKVKQRNEAMKEDVIAKLKDLGNMCLKPFGLSTDSFELQPNGEGGYSVSMKK